MVNPMLVVTALVMTVMVLVASVYFVVHFQHPEDKNTAYFPKIISVTGLAISALSVLLLPMDVADRNSGGGLDMAGLWQAVYMMMAIYCLILVPFTVWYYEGMDEEHQTRTAIGYTVVTFVVAMFVISMMYAFLGFADIPVVDLASGIVQIDPDETGRLACPDLIGGGKCRSEDFTLSLRVSYVVYLIAMLSFIGWFLFVMFGSIGMAALPIDLINAYRFRPKRLELDEYARKKMELRDRSAELMRIGKIIEQEQRAAGGKKTRKQQKTHNKFKNAVYMLEDDFDRLMTAYKERGGNPLKYWAFLFLGVMGASISMMWIVHICVYLLPAEPVDPLLNTMFISLDEAFGLFGTAAYGSFAFYLLWCIIKGIIKFGLRFFFFEIHPIKLGGTMMNSMVFNVGIILLCSITVTQFCTLAFADYARLTAVDNMFGAQTRYLRFVREFFIYYYYGFVIIFFLTLIVLLVRPTDPGKKALNSLK